MQQADVGAGIKARMTEENGASPLPRCFCGWKNCRMYQKAFREFQHPLYDGVVKLKFIKTEPKHMALKAAIDRTLHVESTKQNEWKTDNGESQCRYYVARHHFTEALMKQYLSDKRAWDWNEPLSTKEAKKFLWSLDRQDVYRESGDEKADDSSDMDGCYVQAPNVPKEQVREVLKKAKEEHKKKHSDSPKKNQTQSTLSTSVTDTLKAFEDIIGHQEDNKDSALAKKEEENTRLRQELSETQKQLSMLHSMVKKLQVDMDRSTPEKDKKKNKKKKEQEKLSDEDDSSDESDESAFIEEMYSGGRSRDGEETVSTYNTNYSVGRASAHSRSRHSIRRGSVHSPVRRGSIHSRRSVRRDSYHSRRNSVHSRPRHSIRRDSMHGGASVVSQTDLQSVSPSIKSLPREIELLDDEDDGQSFFDDSTHDDARSAGSRSGASRRSIKSGARRRNSRIPTNPSATKQQQQQQKKKGGAVPREIDLSGDELEDTTHANVSTDTLFVSDKQIVDPYGEKGVYTGAQSKSTGMPNGKGRLEYEKEGRWYEGDWIHGRWTGHGRLSNGDGDFYEGGLKNDHKHGTGTMKFADGRIFEGEYIRGQMIQGKMTYQDGSVYGGSWVDGMRHGRGKCIFVDGSEYEGEFREGNFHGQGKMTWNDGGWYIGEWSEGEMHGKGKEIRPDGSLRHDGQWSRGQPLRNANESRRRRQQQKSSQ